MREEIALAILPDCQANQQIIMFSKFFTSMHIGQAVGRIRTLHRIENHQYTPAYHHPIEQILFDALKGSSTGVFVHWGVFESGKSIAVREVAWRLQQETNRLVIGLQSFDFRCNRSIGQQELRRLIGVPEHMHEPLSVFFTKPAGTDIVMDRLFTRTEGTTIVIDHADLLMRDKDNRGDEMLEMVLALIDESEASKKFNVLLVVTSWERANELMDAGCKLVPGDAPGRWTREQLEALFTAAPESMRAKVGERKDELLNLSTLSGTPGFLTFEAYNDKYCSRHAVMHDIEWSMGTKALYDGITENDKGRFPDRNGVYHHADLATLPAYMG